MTDPTSDRSSANSRRLLKEVRERGRSLLFPIAMYIAAVVAAGALVVAPEEPHSLSPDSVVSEQHVEVGVFPYRVVEFSPGSGRYQYDVYFWTYYDPTVGQELEAQVREGGKLPDGATPAIELLEPVNGHFDQVSTTREHPAPARGRGRVLAWHRALGTFSKNFDLRFFPFETYKLPLALENPRFGAGTLGFLPSPGPNPLTEVQVPSGWTVVGGDVTVGVHQYATCWGLPNRKDLKDYYELRLTIVVRRTWSGFLLGLAVLGPLALTIVSCSVAVALTKGGDGDGYPLEKNTGIEILMALLLALTAQQAALSLQIPEGQGVTLASGWYLLAYLHWAGCLFGVVKLKSGRGPAGLVRSVVPCLSSIGWLTLFGFIAGNVSIWAGVIWLAYSAIVLAWGVLWWFVSIRLAERAGALWAKWFPPERR